MKFCKDCIHRESNGYCDIKKEFVPRKTDKEGKVSNCKKFKSNNRK